LDTHHYGKKLTFDRKTSNITKRIARKYRVRVTLERTRKKRALFTPERKFSKIYAGINFKPRIVTESNNYRSDVSSTNNLHQTFILQCFSMKVLIYVLEFNLWYYHYPCVQIYTLLWFFAFGKTTRIFSVLQHYGCRSGWNKDSNILDAFSYKNVLRF